MSKEIVREIDEMSEEELRHQEEMFGKSLHKIPYEKQNVPIEKVETHPEWQPRERTDPSRLFNPIIIEGLATPPRVLYDPEDDVYHALDARHRWAALQKIKEERPDAWKRHGFDKGVPCHVYKDLSEEQILDLRTDEGRNQEPLAGKVEAFNALKPHYDKGRTDKEIEVNFWRIIADTCVSPAKRNELYEQFRKSNDPAEFMKAVHNATYVHQQRFRALHRCPQIVRDAWKKGELGETDENGNTCPKLTDAEIKKLAKAHQADLAEDEASGFKHNYGVNNPGPGVKAQLEEILESKQQKEKGVQQKPMTKSDRQKHVEHGKSRTEKVIFSAVNGNPQAQAQLENVLGAIGQYEAADDIDHDTLDQVILTITKRGEPVDNKTRSQIIDAIKSAPATKKSKEQPEEEEKTVEKSMSKVAKKTQTKSSGKGSTKSKKKGGSKSRSKNR